MRRALIGLIMVLFLTGVAYAEPHIYVMDTGSGATMQHGGGVSLVGVIPVVTHDIEGYFSYQLGTITFPDDGGSDAASGVTNGDPNGTGTTDMSGTSIYVAYGVSNKPLTTTEWQALGTSGTTEIDTHTIGSGSSNQPHRFFPEASGHIGVFVYSGSSRFLVPKVYTYAR